MKIRLIISTLIIVFFLSHPVHSEGIQSDARYNIWRSQYDWEHSHYDFGTYNGYDDYNNKHPNGEHYYCINGIVKVKTPSGFWVTYSENGIDPIKCGDRLYNNKFKRILKIRNPY